MGTRLVRQDIFRGGPSCVMYEQGIHFAYIRIDAKSRLSMEPTSSLVTGKEDGRQVKIAAVLGLAMRDSSERLHTMAMYIGLRTRLSARRKAEACCLKPVVL